MVMKDDGKEKIIKQRTYRVCRYRPACAGKSFTEKSSERLKIRPQKKQEVRDKIESVFVFFKTSFIQQRSIF